MNYSIKKDSKPEDTTATIKDILNKNHIETEISCTGSGENYYSTRINIVNTTFGTNGKGTCEINALASGYAELIERLQTQYLFKFKNNSYIYNPDEKLIPLENCTDKVLKGITEDLNIDETLIKKILRLNSVINLKNQAIKDFVLVSPFVSYKKREIEYLSTYLMDFLQASNGLASGNTTQEACVQALSEIVERYCARKVFEKQIKMPKIPKKYWGKYEKIVNLKKEIENLGYKITVKDASLGKDFPTTCCVFENLKYPYEVCIKFGTHPYFPIALERTITEFMQGFTCTPKDRVKLNIKPNSLNLEGIIECSFYKKTLLKRTNRFIKNILSDEKDYEFNKKIWLFEEKLNNKELFNKFSNTILKYTDDIYIRNQNFLGFPAVKIYVPKLSLPYVTDLTFFQKRKHVYDWVNYVQNKEKPENFTIEDLMKACKYIARLGLEPKEDSTNFGQMGAKYLGFYCALTLNNKKEIKYFLRKIYNYHSCKDGANKENEILRLYQTFGKYFKLKWKNYSSEKIKEKIEKQFGKELWKEINNILSVVSKKAIFESLVSKENNQETEYMKYLQKQLGEIYKNNPPNQNEIKKIIKKPNIFQKLFIS